MWIIPRVIQERAEDPTSALHGYLLEAPPPQTAQAGESDYHKQMRFLAEAGLSDASEMITEERKKSALLEQQIGEINKAMKEKQMQDAQVFEKERNRLIVKSNRLIDKHDDLYRRLSATEESRQRAESELQNARNLLDTMKEKEEERTMGPIRKLRSNLRSARASPVVSYSRPKNKAEALKMRYSMLNRDSTYLNTLHAAARDAFPIDETFGTVVNEAISGERDRLLDPHIVGRLKKFNYYK